MDPPKTPLPYPKTPPHQTFLTLHIRPAHILLGVPERRRALEIPIVRWGVTGPSPEVIAGSEAFVNTFHPAMIEAMGPDWTDLGIKGDSKTFVGSQQGALTGSIFSIIPVVTVEMAVITQPEDEAFIGSPEGQDRMARAIFAGLEAYFSSK